MKLRKKILEEKEGKEIKKGFFENKKEFLEI